MSIYEGTSLYLYYCNRCVFSDKTLDNLPCGDCRPVPSRYMPKSYKLTSEEKDANTENQSSV